MFARLLIEDAQRRHEHPLTRGAPRMGWFWGAWLLIGRALHTRDLAWALLLAGVGVPVLGWFWWRYCRWYAWLQEELQRQSDANRAAAILAGMNDDR